MSDDDQTTRDQKLKIREELKECGIDVALERLRDIPLINLKMARKLFCE